jgi:DNA invertase Pin-like site-specific DNA recombinase
MTPAVPAQTTPAVIYRRVSTDEQAASGLGLEAQYDTCEKHTASRGWEPLAVFTDAGVSGSTPLRERPAGAAAVALAKATGAILVVAKLDRIGRDAIDRMTLLRDAAKEGWRIESPDMSGIDPTTPEGRMMHGVMASFAEYERALIGVRTSAAINAKLRRGERWGRRPEISEAAVARILRLADEGYGPTTIARMLDDEGIDPPRAGRWNRDTVRRIITGAPSGRIALKIWREQRQQEENA